MSDLLAIAPSLASIQSALDQPLFPGKLVMWLLIMVSIVSWVMILSKALQLRRAKRADDRFGQRLKRARTTLEVFEEGWDDEHSLQHLIYLAGAREAAFQLLGSREPRVGVQERVREAGGLSGRQARFLRQAFRAGYRAARVRLSEGTAPLRLVAVAAAFLGSIGFLWTLMTGLDAADQSTEIAAAVGSALGFAVVGTLVAGPALLARIGFSIHERNRRRELSKFHQDVARLFERKFCRAAESVEPGEAVRGVAGRADSSAPERSGRDVEMDGGEDEDDEEQDDDDDDKKRYHSIRERLLRPDSDAEGESDINPIARQANTLRVP